MEYKTFVFDQDGTLYPKTSQLGVELSRATKYWLCEKGKMDNEQFDIFKNKYPNFTEGLNSLNLDLISWHEEVQTSLIDRIDGIVDINKRLIEIIIKLRNCYLVTFSSVNFSDAVLINLGVQEHFKKKIHINNGSKIDAYRNIQLNQNNTPAETLVIGDNDQADLAPARELGMSTLLIDSRRDLVDQINHLIK